MKYLVVGGGISGLYSAYSLHKKFGTNDMMIIERDDHIGGHYMTFDLGFRTIELGAAIFLNIHTNILSLINELGLSDKLVLIKSERSYGDVDGQKIKQINKLSESGFVDTINDIQSKIINKEIPIDLARSYSLFRLLERTYGIDTATKINNEFGYDGDITRQNSIDALNMLHRDLNRPFYSMNGGLKQIIDKLHDYFEINKIPIQLNSELVNIKKSNNKYRCMIANGTSIEADNVILSIPTSCLAKIRFLSPIRELLNSVSIKSLMRIYLIFPTENGHSWFDHLNGIITTATKARQIIPVDKKHGVIMIYVSDDASAAWKYLDKTNLLKNEVMDCFRKLFGNNIPDPTKVIVKYWQEGTHIWKPTVDSSSLSQQILKPFNNEQVYIVGESYSMIQQWSQGALDTVNHLMSLLKQ